MVVQENALKVQCLGFSVASSGEGADCNHLVSPFPCKCVGETTVAVKLAKNVTKNVYTLDLKMFIYNVNTVFFVTSVPLFCFSFLNSNHN